MEQLCSISLCLRLLAAPRHSTVPETSWRNSTLSPLLSVHLNPPNSMRPRSSTISGSPEISKNSLIVVVLCLLLMKPDCVSSMISPTLTSIYWPKRAIILESSFRRQIRHWISKSSLLLFGSGTKMVIKDVGRHYEFLLKTLRFVCLFVCHHNFTSRGIWNLFVQCHLRIKIPENQAFKFQCCVNFLSQSQTGTGNIIFSPMFAATSLMLAFPPGRLCWLSKTSGNFWYPALHQKGLIPWGAVWRAEPVERFIDCYFFWRCRSHHSPLEDGVLLLLAGGCWRDVSHRRSNETNSTEFQFL